MEGPQTRTGIVLGIVLVWSHCAFALNPSLDVNQYAHTAWKTSEGFTKGVIFSLAQTPDGYLWLGTEFGLLRFDGARAVPWQPPAGKRLPSNDIRKLCVARDGRLWIGTTGGLASWKDGRLTPYPELDGKAIETLFEDHQGTVWVGTWAPPSGRLCAIQGAAMQCYGEEGRFGSSVTALYEDSGGNLWAGATTGLWRWTPGPPKLYTMPDATRRIHALIEDGGVLLIAKNNGMIRLRDKRFEAYPLLAGFEVAPMSLLRDRNGGLWVGEALNHGLLRAHEGRTDLYTRSDGLSGNAVTALLEDREGNIWVATTDGLDRFREFAVHTMSAKQGFFSRGVESILAARDGSIWLGADDGLQRWKGGWMTTYRNRTQPARGGDTQKAGLPEQTRGFTQITVSELPDHSVASLLENRRGQIWVATLRGIAIFDSGRLVSTSPMPPGIVYSMAEGAGGSVWISHADGLFRLLGASVVERISLAKFGHKGVATALIHDPLHEGLWVGLLYGGVAFLAEGQIRESYTAGNGLGAGRVNGFNLDGDGTLWVSTEGGLSRLKNKNLATLTSGNGLPCNAVKWVIEDDAHSFWLYMPCGLVRIARSELDAWAASPKRTIQATVFDNSDGFISHSFTSGYSPPVAKAPDGTLWFNTFGVVSIIDPHNLPFNNLPPPVHIESIKADGKVYELRPGIGLPANVRDLSIGYTALSFVAPEKVHFKYKLEGQDRDWREVVNDRDVQYTNLAPRKYIFRVIASNNNGVWNEAGDALEFSIAPAWNQTTWFYASCVAAFLAMPWGLYRLRLYQIQREFNAQLDGRVDERLRVARDLHDTMLQTFQAALIQMQAGYNLLSRRPEKAAEAIEEAIATSSSAIAEGRDAIQNMRSSTVESNDLARALRIAGDQMAVECSARFDVSVQGSSRDLHPILRDDVYRIALEALRNAFKHAEAHAIEAEILYGESLRVRIRDNGKGIAPATIEEGRRSGHYGLPGMRERAERIGGKLDLWSGAGAGTEIQLTIPGNIAFGKSGAGSLLGRFRRKSKSDAAAQR